MVAGAAFVGFLQATRLNDTQPFGMTTTSMPAHDVSISARARRNLVLGVACATAWTGILAGTGLVQVVVHMPARTRIGDAGYLAYLQATALSRGAVLYPLVGIVGLSLDLAVLAIAIRVRTHMLVRLLGAAMIAASLGLVTAIRALPAARALRDAVDSPATSALLDRFGTTTIVRVLFVEATFACLFVALVALARGANAGDRRLLRWMVVTTLTVFVLGGAGVPMMIVDRPAWLRIGAVAYVEYARVTDTGNGRFVYIPLAWAGAFLCTATFALARRWGAERAERRWLGCAAACAWLVLATTAGAAPALLRALASPSDERVLTPLLARFDFWSIPRSAFLLGTFWSMIAALATRALRGVAIRRVQTGSPGDTLDRVPR